MMAGGPSPGNTLDKELVLKKLTVPREAARAFIL